MKKTLFLLTTTLFLLSAMTSCLKDSDNSNSSTYHTITSAEKATIVKNIRQHYAGYVKYVTDSFTVDSIQSSLAFNSDSTAMLDFPVSILANYLTDASVSAEKDILRKAPNSYIECGISIPVQVYTGIWTNYYQEAIYPNILFYPKNTVSQFKVGDNTYELTFSYNYLIFQNETYNPILQYFNKQAYAFLILSSIKTNSGLLLYINKPVEFVGKVS